MSVAPVRQLLAQAQLISAFDYAPGYVGLLSRGVRAIDRLHAAFARLATDLLPVRVVASPELTEVETYRERYGASHDYQNVYALTTPSGRHVVRPDSLAEMVSQGAATPGTMLANPRPIFRADTTSPSPLMRDKHLCGVVQAVTVTDPTTCDAVLRDHAQLVTALHTEIRLPMLLVEAPPLRAHADRRYLSFCVTPNGRLWLTSTLYVLGRGLTDPMGGTGPVVELGFTAKLLALAVAAHSDAVGPLLPCALSHEQVVSAGEGRPWEGLVRRARREGLPFVVAPDSSAPDARVAYVRAQDRFVPADSLLADVAGAARAHDDVLWRRAVAATEGVLDDPKASAAWGAAPRGDDDYVLGTVTSANFDRGTRAAGLGHVLLSHKHRLY